jgi:PAS domain S-box-containing protein
MTHAEQGRESAGAVILIVEDEQIVAADIQRRLERMGYRVPASVPSGEEALRAVEETRPDLLLVDIVLEGPVDGIQLVTELRSRLSVPVIYLTAYTDEETVRRARATHPSGFVVKPFDERELHYTIEIALQNWKAERELQRSEEIYRDVAEHGDQAHWLLDAGLLTTLFVSGAHETIWGVRRPVPGSGLEAWLTSLHAEDREQMKVAVERACRGDVDAAGLESRILRPDGTQRTVWTRLFPVRDRAGTITRIAISSQDITRQKWAWETMRESEERHRLLVEHAPDLISRHTAEGIFVFASPASRTVLGIAPDELLGRSIADLVHPDDLQGVLRAHRTLRDALLSGPLRYRARRPDGTDVLVETTANAIRGPLTDEIREINAVTRKVDDRVRPGEEPRKTAVIADTARELMALINREYLHEDANEAYCAAHGRRRNELVGQSLRSVWLEETFNAVIKEPVDRCLAGEMVTYESWFTLGSLGRRCLEMRHYPHRNTQGEVTHCVIVGLDVTDRRTAEDRARATLKEKDVQLKEIHHRVKNNLQVISSLLNLQQNTVSSKESRDLLRESQSRIRSMGLIHEQLYQSDTPGAILLEEYVRSLTRELFRSYGASGISLTLEIEELRLSAETMVPCGLVINELVSNALKHAFPAGRTGTIHCRAMRTSKDRVALSVADDGVGLPGDLDVRTTSTLGFQLVNMLVKQLRGTMDIVRGDGTTFLITFPVR